MGILSVTKPNDREVTITISKEQKKLLNIASAYLANNALDYKLTMLMYEVEEQNIVVFHFTGGNKESIRSLLTAIEGLD